jgi:hypothetical protein
LIYLKQSRAWVNLRRARALAWRLIDNYQIIRLAPLIREMTKAPDFPGSRASQKQWLEISLLGFQNTIPALLYLAETENQGYDQVIPKSIEIFDSNEEVLALRQILDKQGSDKGTKHQYDLIYANMLRLRRNEKISILEIGLGTNKSDTPSNMGKAGVPGASLRAWKEYFSYGVIVGCDIDSRILFQEDRITTYQLDQTSTASWRKFLGQAPINEFDLVIDDGLHAPFPNLATVRHTLPLLTKDGILVIEDVTEAAIPVWELLRIVFKNKWELEIIQTNVSYVVVISKSKRISKTMLA